MMTRAADVILVEDDPDDLFLQLRALRRVRPDVRVLTVRDGIELLEVLDGPPVAHRRLVLLDLNLPRMDGREVLQRLSSRSRPQGLAIVVLTTSVEIQERQRVLALGADDFATKPDEFSALVEQLRVLLDHWLPALAPVGG